MKKLKYQLVQRPPQMGIWEKTLFTIIRPPKIQYSNKTIDQNLITYNNPNIAFQKYNQTVEHQNEKIEVTVFKPINKDKQSLNLIIYCHCNASNKLECISYINKLPQNYAIAGFDFLGCGNTKQYYLSVGFRESKQIQSIYNVFKEQYKNIILWGRSMGAVSIIKFEKGLINICDSPFSSLKKLTKQYAYRTPKIPNCLICCVFPCVYCKLRSDIEQRADFNIDDLNLKESIGNMNQNQSIIFIISKDDNLIVPEHSKELFREFKGKNKKLFQASGDHNTPRSKQLINKIFDELDQILNNKPSISKQIQDSATYLNDQKKKTTQQ